MPVRLSPPRVIMDIWHWTPFVTLTLLAGLTALPREPMEQAMVDGANRWQVLRFLTIPMMMPVLLTTVFIRMMDALRIVDEVYMLTSGGPGTATRYIGILIFGELCFRKLTTVMAQPCPCWSCISRLCCAGCSL